MPACPTGASPLRTADTLMHPFFRFFCDWCERERKFVLAPDEHQRRRRLEKFSLSGTQTAATTKMAAAYNSGLDAQVQEQRDIKMRQKLFERAENLRHLSTAGSSDPDFIREQETRLLSEARALGMDPVCKLPLGPGLSLPPTPTLLSCARLSVCPA